MTAAAPSATNVFIKDHEGSNKMVVDFARNVKSFALNRYAQIVPASKVAGYYLKMTVEQAGRLVNSNLDAFKWADGHEAPKFEGENETFEFLPFECVRYAYGFNLGDLTISQASWDILASHASQSARRAMTARTQAAIAVVTNTNNHIADHVIDVRAISGNTGTWVQSTVSRQDIKRSLNTAAEKILDETLAAVSPSDLMVVINSALAARLSECQEIVDYIAHSPEALAQVRGELPGKNVMYGLPDRLYGFPIEVEVTRKVTTRKGATTARSQILPTATPFMCARPGGLVGIENAPNFSSIVIFEQESMTVETLRDANNRRTTGRVVDCFDAKLVAPASTVLFTHAE